MLRRSRSTASIVRALVLGCAQVTTAAALCTAIVACQDESKPEYWVEKLQDPAWRPRAIKRLEQFFEDTYTRSNRDLAAPDVKALSALVVEPLVKTYAEAYGDLDDKTRETLIKLIVGFRDARSEPALKKAFEEFAKKGKGGLDVKWASRAVVALKPKGLAEVLIQAYDKCQPSKEQGYVAYRELNDALLTVADPSWSGLLKQKLAADITLPPQDKQDPAAVDAFKDELYWQTTAAQLLGDMGDASAVEPLMQVMLDPAKADVQATAVLALVKIGKPAVERALSVLQDKDEKLSAYAIARAQKAGNKDAAKEKPYIATAALVLGVIGRQDALPAMVAVLDASKDETQRAIIARELAKFPPTDASKAAFKKAFASISLDASIVQDPALPLLVESAGQFYDPTMITWLIERGDKTNGAGEAKQMLQSAVEVTTIKLMKPDQMAEVSAAIDKFKGTKLEKDAFKQAADLLKACGDRTDCYLAAIEKSDNQEPANQFVAIKAGYMLGIYGDEKARDGIIERLDSIENAAVRFTAAQTIDKLSPKGSVEAANKLQAIVDKNAKSPDKAKSQGDTPLKQVMYRIRSRAQ